MRSFKLAAIALAFLLLLAATPAWASTVVVDGACPTPGNGVGGYTSTCDGTAAGNPATTVADGLAAMVAGDTLDIRGIHSAHGSCPGSTTGRYFHTADNQTSLDCTSSPCVMESSGWTGVGTGEHVYIEGGESLTWAQCTWDGNCDCDAGHTNLTTLGDGTQAACQATWWVTTTDNHVVRPDGSPTFRIACTAGLSELDNSTAGYLRDRCSGANDAWRACKSAADCPSGQTCTSNAVTEVDSCENGGVLFARLGASATPNSDGTKARPAGNGDGMVFKNGSKNWTLRGIIFKNHGRYQGVNIEGHFGVSNANITLNDIGIFYVSGNAGEGSDYGLGIYNTTPVTVTNSEIAYTGSEGIHTEGACTDGTCTTAMATVHTISNNYFHDGDAHNLLGNVNTGTPCNVIVGETGGSSGPGNYSGTVYSGNLFFRSGTNARGFIVENNVSNLVLRDNIFQRSGSTCLRLTGNVAGTHTDNNQFFNNYFIDCGVSSEGSLQITPGSGTTSGNSFYNNTFIDTLGRSELYNDTGIAASNMFRNNIFYTTAGTKPVNWTNTDATNHFQNNLVYTTAAGTAVTWLNSGYTCSTLSTIESGNVNGCQNPLFVNVSSNDYHIQTTSPAKDVGTATGMPAGRTTDICNTLAISHGLPDYNNCHGIQNGVWDIGAHEFSASSSRRVMIISGLRPRKPKEGE